MLILEPSPTFLNEGAIVPDKDELEAIIHALVAEQMKVVKHQTNYGPLTIGQFNRLIVSLQEYKAKRGP